MDLTTRVNEKENVEQFITNTEFKYQMTNKSIEHMSLAGLELYLEFLNYVRTT
jgi:hypothetical protein